MKLFNAFGFLRKKDLPATLVAPESPIVARCGHLLPSRSLTVTLFGHEETYVVPEKIAGPPLHCFDCLIKEAVPCACCGLAIVPGDPVMQVVPRKDMFVAKPGSLSVKESLGEVVACWRCAGSPALLSGAVLRSGRTLETEAYFAFEGLSEKPRRRLQCVTA
jgi:hypothetical protein